MAMKKQGASTDKKVGFATREQDMIAMVLTKDYKPDGYNMKMACKLTSVIEDYVPAATVKEAGKCVSLGHVESAPADYAAKPSTIRSRHSIVPVMPASGPTAPYVPPVAYVPVIEGPEAEKRAREAARLNQFFNMRLVAITGKPLPLPSIRRPLLANDRGAIGTQGVDGWASQAPSWVLAKAPSLSPPLLLV